MGVPQKGKLPGTPGMYWEYKEIWGIPYIREYLGIVVRTTYIEDGQSLYCISLGWSPVKLSKP